jgi:hypothetical protein
MMDKEVMDWLWPRALFWGVLLAIFLWFELLLYYPLAWACLTGGSLTIALGYFTARVIFQISTLWKALALSPFFGAFWIGLLWVVIKITNI